MLKKRRSQIILLAVAGLFLVIIIQAIITSHWRAQEIQENGAFVTYRAWYIWLPLPVLEKGREIQLQRFVSISANNKYYTETEREEIVGLMIQDELKYHPKRYRLEQNKNGHWVLKEPNKPLLKCRPLRIGPWKKVE